MWRIKAIVKLKEGVLDVQGRAVESTLHQIGYLDAQNLRVGKFIEFSCSRKPEEKELNQMGKDLLANPIIETITFEVEKA